MAFYNGELIKDVIISDSVDLLKEINAKLRMVYYPNGAYGIIYEQNKNNNIKIVTTTESITEVLDLFEKVEKATNGLKTDAEIEDVVKYCGTDRKYNFTTGDESTISEFFDIIQSYEVRAKKSFDENEDITVSYIEARQQTDDFIVLLEGMADNIADKIDADSYSRTTTPKHLRKYLDIDPFNYGKKQKELISDADEVKKAKNEIYQEIEELASHISTFLNSYDVTDDPKFQSKLIKSLTFDTTPSHIKLRYGGNKQDKLEFAETLERELNVKVLNTGATLEKYYLHNKGYYTKLNPATLQQIIKDLYGVTLAKQDIDGAYNNIVNNPPLLDEYVNFGNGVYNIKNNTFTHRETDIFNVANLETNFILKNIGIKQDDKTLDLIDFNQDMYLGDIKRVIDPSELDSADISLVEKTLRQILIPKNNPSDLSMYIGFLERVGNCIESKNNYKVCSFYYGLGDDGKSILNHMTKLIFNYNYKMVSSATLQDNFKAQDFKNKSIIAIDEISEKDLNSPAFINEFKKMTSNTGSDRERAIYSSDYEEIEQYPPLFIYANNLPIINRDEISLLSRYDIHIMPNRFVEASEVNSTPNSYQKDRDLPNKLKQDINGLSWLISAGIRCYEDMKQEGRHFADHQLPSETYRIITGNDIITEFIDLYTDIGAEDMTKEDYTFNKEIVEQLKTYANMKGDIIKENTVAKDIGNVLSVVYGSKLIKEEKPSARYNIVLKSFDDIEKENKIAYSVNECVTDAQLDNMKYLSNEQRIVYKEIQKGNNTINSLSSKYIDINVREQINHLLNLGLIISSDTIGLFEN